MRDIIKNVITPNGDAIIDDTNDAIRVNIVAGSSGGTEYTEDAAAAANPAGSAQILVRQDTPATLVTTDGDNVARRGTNYGAAYSQIVTSAGAFVDSFGGGTQYTEADVDATITGTAIMFESNTGTNALSVVNNTTPLPVADAGGSLTVDNATISVVGGGVEATAQRVTIASDSTGVLSVDDNGGSLTVDNAALSVVGGGVEATALRVTIASDSTGVLSIDDNAGTLTVDQATASNLNAQVVGTAAHASPTSGNPVYIAGRASTAVPADVGADGDAAGMWVQRNGAQVVTMAPHMGLVGALPWTLTSESAQYTTQQTSTVLVAGGASDRIVVTSLQIQVGGTTAGAAQVYFGTGAYARGTDEALFDGEFAPSATAKPGVFFNGPFIAGALGDDILVTTSAAINPITVTVWYYIVT